MIRANRFTRIALRIGSATKKWGVGWGCVVVGTAALGRHDFPQNPEKHSDFPQKDAKSGRPNAAVPTTTLEDRNLLK